MFLLDDIVCSPFNSLLYVFRELHRAVQQDAVNEAEAIRAVMSELYMLLETGQITEEEADAQEKELLDRLDEIETRRQNSEEDSEDEDAEEETEATDDIKAEESPPTMDEIIS